MLAIVTLSGPVPLAERFADCFFDKEGGVAYFDEGVVSKAAWKKCFDRAVLPYGSWPGYPKIPGYKCKAGTCYGTGRPDAHDLMRQLQTYLNHIREIVAFMHAHPEKYPARLRPEMRPSKVAVDGKIGVATVALANWVIKQHFDWVTGTNVPRPMSTKYLTEHAPYFAWAFLQIRDLLGKSARYYWKR
jgi:hypothetical protein